MRFALYVPHVPDENTTPPLGPLYLLAVLEKAGIEGRLFDARLGRAALEELVAYGPGIVGVSAVTPGYEDGLRAAKAVKERLGDIPVIFGGPHPTSLPEDVLRESAVDYVLTGECEGALSKLCSLLGEGKATETSLRHVPNLWFKKGEAIQHTESLPFLSPEELDALPWPAFHLMDLETYFSGTQTHGLFRRGKRILPIMTGRGCPQNCTYCCRVMGQRVRERSTDSVMAEIRHLVDTYAVDEIYIEDDTFTIPRARALDILERLASFTPPIYIKFANGVRADLVDSELLAAMKRARVYSLSFGIESGCEATLKKMKKHLDLERARENVLLAKSMGFLVGANCIIGYPGETLADIEVSMNFFLALPLDSMAIVNLVPFPGTEVRRICEEKGYLTEHAARWGNYFFSINNPIPLIETPALSQEDLVRAVKRAYRRMYMRPKWLWRSLRHLSIRQIIAGAVIMLGRKRRAEPPRE